MKKLATLLIAFAANALAQTPVSLSAGPPPSPVVKLLYYDGSSNLQYICMAAAQSGGSSVTRAATTLTSVVVLTNVGTVTTSSAHGLYVGARVTVSGATVDTDLNGTYTVATVTSSTTYTIATVAVANATYNESTLVISTSWPLTTASRWAIEILTYSGTTLQSSYWAGASSGYGLACTDRAAY